MIDRHEILVRIRANVDGWADAVGLPTGGAADEATALATAMDPGRTGAATPDAVDRLRRDCAAACLADLTDHAREGATTVGLLADAIAAALLIPDAARTDDDAAPTALVIAIDWTGENECALALGRDRNEALRAFAQAHPAARADRLEIVEAHAQPGGGWAAVVDP